MANNPDAYIEGGEIVDLFRCASLETSDSQLVAETETVRKQVTSVAYDPDADME